MHTIRRVMLVLFAVLLCCASGWTDVKPAGIFGLRMVLQRDIAVPVWGWAEPGEAVTVEFAGQKMSAKTNADGKWMVRLKPMPVGGDGTASGQAKVLMFWGGGWMEYNIPATSGL